MTDSIKSTKTGGKFGFEIRMDAKHGKHYKVGVRQQSLDSWLLRPRV
jgi:hypothetical protein